MIVIVSVLYRAVRQTLSGRECLYADGGILDQYPISSFDGIINYNCFRSRLYFSHLLFNWLFSVVNTDQSLQSCVLLMLICSYPHLHILKAAPTNKLKMTYPCHRPLPLPH